MRRQPLNISTLLPAGSALRFIPVAELEKDGHGEYLALFEEDAHVAPTNPQ